MKNRGRENFSIGNTVTWRADFSPFDVARFRGELGTGPFRVVEVFQLQGMELLMADHPQHIVIEKDGKPVGEEKKWSGVWFEKEDATKAGAHAPK